jgi:hypothetical protein
MASVYTILKCHDPGIQKEREAIAKGSAVKMRGLAAFSFAGAIRILGQLLRRACNFVLDATYTLGRLHPLRT